MATILQLKNKYSKLDKGFLATLIVLVFLTAAGAVINYYNIQTPKVAFLDRARQNTLHIRMMDPFNQQQVRGAGSGTFFKDNVVITAGHVCRGTPPELFEVVDFQRRLYKVKAIKIHDNTSIDLCVMWLTESPSLLGTPIARSDSALIGSYAFIPGFSGGRVYSIRSGTIYSEELINIMGHEGPLEMRLQFIAVPAQPGISGSGVINALGEMVGVANAVGSIGLGLVPLKDLLDFLKDTGVYAPGH